MNLDRGIDNSTLAFYLCFSSLPRPNLTVVDKWDHCHIHSYPFQFHIHKSLHSSTTESDSPFSKQSTYVILSRCVKQDTGNVTANSLRSYETVFVSDITATLRFDSLSMYYSNERLSERFQWFPQNLVNIKHTYVCSLYLRKYFFGVFPSSFDKVIWVIIRGWFKWKP